MLSEFLEVSASRIVAILLAMTEKQTIQLANSQTSVTHSECTHPVFFTRLVVRLSIMEHGNKLDGYSFIVFSDSGAKLLQCVIAQLYAVVTSRGALPL